MVLSLLVAGALVVECSCSDGQLVLICLGIGGALMVAGGALMVHWWCSVWRLVVL